MPNDTLVNARSPVTQKSNGTAITFPNVCKTPVGSAVVPIPYPNIAKSNDLAKGSKNVTINNASVCLDNSELSTSTGDEAGTLKGIISSTNKGKAFPILSSFDVKTEGKNVVRNTDPFLGNNRNTPPGPILQAQVTPVILPPTEEEKCPYCKKKKHDFAKKPGNHCGNGQKLRKKIIADIKQHQWYAGSHSLEAHHLICSEAMNDVKWPDWCADFGYNIDCKENGVILPYWLELACQLHVPLHRGGHAAGIAQGIPYPRKIKIDLKEIGEKIKSGQFCDNPQKLTDELNKYSKKVLSQVDKFIWTISGDGRDYKPGGKGCAGADNIQNKPQQSCPHNRLHKITRKGNITVLNPKIAPLEIGK
ncbi:MAG TPA: PAAR-like domain-containing protein [Cellvibrio sp.]|nr:PAAR-like domain-containing protein [Cellvibrio sp.]